MPAILWGKMISGVHVGRAEVTRDQGGSLEDKFQLILPGD